MSVTTGGCMLYEDSDVLLLGDNVFSEIILVVLRLRNGHLINKLF